MAETLRKQIANEVTIIYRQHFPICINPEVPINFGLECADSILSHIKEMVDKQKEKNPYKEMSGYKLDIAYEDGETATATEGYSHNAYNEALDDVKAMLEETK